MAILSDRRVIALGGGAVALAAGLAIAWFIFARGHKPTEPPPASQGGLTVVSGRDDDAKLDPCHTSSFQRSARIAPTPRRLREF
jgi:hypothetical protein